MTPSIKRILVPTDFSPIAMDTLDGALFIANAVNADITLLHVFETVSFNSTIEKMLNLGRPSNKLVETNVDELFTSIVEQLKITHPLVKITTMKASGKIYEEITKAAKKVKADVIIMGTHGVSGVDKYLLGTNAERVVKTAECAVITFKENPANPGLDNILLPLDLTSETREKVGKAIELAQIFKASIHVISVLTTDDEFIVNKLTRQLNQVESYIRSCNVSCKAEMIYGDNIANTIIDFAAKIKVDLVVIMSQEEREGFTDYFLGSTAQRIINNSLIPVLSIRPMKRKDTTVFVPY